MLDLKIDGAMVIDGTGSAGSRADVGIRGETIAAIGDLSRESAGRVLNASGRVLAPGFIDMHSHSDWRLWGNRRAESKIRQGVTTEVVGNCGFSPAPTTTAFLDDMRRFALYIPTGMDFSWRSVGEYLRAFDRGGTALNVVQLVGHGTLRVAAMGFARRPPSAAELTLMQRMLGDAMEEGAWGLSTGLIYAPGSYSTTEEIIEVAKAAVRQRGFYASHIRGEGATLLDAVREAIRIGREADLPVQISHVKASGRPNWGRVADALALIDEARAEGLDVMGDVYPYTASSTSLRTLLPDWVLEGGVDEMLKRIEDVAVRGRIRTELEAPVTGQSLLDRIGWDNIMIAWCPKRKDAEGRRLRAPPRRPGRGLDDHVPARRGRSAPRAGASARDDRLRRLVAGHLRRDERRQAAPAQLRHLPARARPVRAGATPALAVGGGPQDDRYAGAPSRPARPRAHSRRCPRRSRRLRSAPGRRRGHLRRSAPLRRRHRARARQRQHRDQGR
jgi:N-acyl-D-amino-acid deacylase